MREEKKKEKMEKINLIPYSNIYNDNRTFIMLLKRKA